MDPISGVSANFYQTYADQLQALNSPAQAPQTPPRAQAPPAQDAPQAPTPPPQQQTPPANLINLLV